MALKNSVPKSLRGPVGFLSITVALLSTVVGYIFVMFGLSLYFDLTSLDPGAMSKTESLVVLAVGIATLGLGYTGWRGFTYFSY
ncbi:hypothetical protein [Halomicrococcus gelatinilyticus]|uniref:hypothetical protein n=1 Tax=Halomicrococcus gelatinilyticus TaxID=1702103 RepID=UPI002E152A65